MKINEKKQFLNRYSYCEKNLINLSTKLMIQNYESARKPANSAFVKKEGSFKEDFNLLCRGWVKSIYSEKATKFCEISTILLSYVVPVASQR